MVRWPWSSKPKKERDEEGTSNAVNLTKGEFERYGPECEDPRIPRQSGERLWSEKGLLERSHDKKLEMYEGVKDTHQGSMDQKQMDKLDKIAWMLMTSEFHDPVRNFLVFDLFERTWGTEVMVHVWWAGLDDILITIHGDAFLIEVDLGPNRTVSMSTEDIVTIGGKRYAYFKALGFKFLRPELSLRNQTLHLTFEGITPPEEKWRNVTGMTELPTSEIIAGIERSMRRSDDDRSKLHISSPQAPKL